MVRRGTRFWPEGIEAVFFPRIWPCACQGSPHQAEDTGPGHTSPAPTPRRSQKTTRTDSGENKSQGPPRNWWVGSVHVSLCKARTWDLGSEASGEGSPSTAELLFPGPCFSPHTLQQSPEHRPLRPRVLGSPPSALRGAAHLQPTPSLNKHRKTRHM